MKFNKWTLGLAAVGAVSLASVAQADEKPSPLTTAVSSTILSGYVNTSAHWNPGTGNANVPGFAYNSTAKSDGFNLDVVKLSLEKPLDESEWAAGYKVDVLFGPDANALGTSPVGGIAATDFAIKQAYVSLRTPIGNGIDWKIGVWDTIIGYESFDAGNNPNYTRSYGYTIEPTTHTGLQGNYKVADWLSFSAAIANTTGPIIGGETIGAPFANVSVGRANPPKAESYKTYMGSAALTAPDSWGFLKGSSFYVGIINGWGGGATVTGDQLNFYAGATLNTPVTGLKAGASYDYVGRPNGQSFVPNGGGTTTIAGSWANAAAVYASYQATEKLSVHGRAEYLWAGTQAGLPTTVGGISTPSVITGTPSQVFALTGTLQYDLWKNVISRLEVRWDHDAAAGKAYGGNLSQVGGVNAGVPDAANNSSNLKKNAFLIAANIIYKF
jgi:hypothetical protein